MKLSLQTFASLVQGMAAAAQSASGQLLDLAAGSTLRALLEANASVGLWMQWLIVQVLQMTRAATSNGADLDSWVADFSLARLPASFATGIVTLSRMAPTMPTVVPTGAIVRTSDGGITFVITADAGNPAWNGSQNGYSLPAGTVAIDVPVIAQLPGTAGNVQAGTVSMLASAIPGVDAVLNASPFSNGMDAESDAALRLRFQAYLASRSRATRVAVGYAISSIQQGLNYTIAENVDTAGRARIGNFVVTVDDGSGAPSPALLSAVYGAVDAIRPLGSSFSVRAPDIVPVAVTLLVSLSAEADRNAVIARIVDALTRYIDKLPIGGVLRVTRVSQVAYDCHPAVEAVGQVHLNGTALNVVAGVGAVIKVTTVVVS